jgi:transcription elongation factor GreA
MNNKPVYLTAEGLAKLQAELIHLITVERPRVAARIHDAKLDGDITENAEYEDAKQEQSFLEGRIGTLEAQLKNAEVIEKTNGDKVGIGSKVVIRGADGQETFTIVGSAEAAPREGRISNESPVGAALMGHKKGDTVIVEAPAGEVTFTVVSIHLRPITCSGPTSWRRASPARRSSTTPRPRRGPSTSGASAAR